MRPRLPRTLRARLLLGLLLPLGVVLAVGALLDYRTARVLIDEAHDRALASTAVGLSARLETERDGDLPAHLTAMMHSVGRARPGDRLVYLVEDARGRAISGDVRLSAHVPEAPAATPRAFDTTLDGQPLRAMRYDYAGPDGSARIVVAETLGGRAAETRRMLAATALSNLTMAGAVMLITVLGVGLALRPIVGLGARIEGLRVQDLQPVLVPGVPGEIRPLARALNRLLLRVRRSVQERQQFIDHTAHQLRTPIAGLAAQIELLAQQPLPPDVAPRVREIGASARRLAHLAHQMLTLARADAPDDAAPAPQPVDLPALLHEVGSRCLDAALARDVDLGFEPHPATVQGTPWMLREMLVNLVDNAIVHTPRGSVVNVRCGPAEGGGAFVEVEDDGPGIPADERERVFDRFVRLAAQDTRGSGLGLAIVREVARRHGASVELADGDQGRGLKVRVRLPG